MIDESAKKLGQALVAAGVLKASQLEAAIQKASKEKTANIIVSLLDLGFLTFKVFEKFLSATQNIKSAIIASHDLNSELVLKVGAETITSSLVVPISTRVDKGIKYLALGMVDPTDSPTVRKIEKSTGFKIIPILISLPDFKEVIRKNQGRIKSLEQIDLKTIQKEDPFVIVGGSNQGDRRTEYRSPPNTGAPTAVTLPTDQSNQSFDPKSRAGEKPPLKVKTEASKLAIKPIAEIEPFGPQGRKFKEEVLAKLDLDHTEAPLLTEEIYTRQVLYQHLQKLSFARLEKIFQKVPPELKVEALANALISKGLLSKQDMLLSSAISLAFKEEKK